jgi:hypothetical protein
MYKYSRKRELKRLEDNTFRVYDVEEDFYSEQAIINKVKESQDKFEYLNKKIESLSKQEELDMVAHTMMVGMIGAVVVIKKLKELKLDPDEDLLKLLNEDQLKEVENPMTEEEKTQYEKAKKYCDKLLLNDLAKSKVELNDLKETYVWWKEALDTGISVIFHEKVLDI